METAASAKLWMSLCVCIQLLKIIKFTNVIVPKMSLMTRVLAKGCYDLLFFGIIFMIAMFAFCMLFHVQVRPAAPHPTPPPHHLTPPPCSPRPARVVHGRLLPQPSSMIALAKALFGDFPFEEIMDNSRGYLNAMMFIMYSSSPSSSCSRCSSRSSARRRRRRGRTRRRRRRAASTATSTAPLESRSSGSNRRCTGCEPRGRRRGRRRRRRGRGALVRGGGVGGGGGRAPPGRHGAQHGADQAADQARLVGQAARLRLGGASPQAARDAGHQARTPRKGGPGSGEGGAGRPRPGRPGGAQEEFRIGGRHRAQAEVWQLSRSSSEAEERPRLAAVRAHLAGRRGGKPAVSATWGKARTAEAARSKLASAAGTGSAERRGLGSAQRGGRTSPHDGAPARRRRRRRWRACGARPRRRRRRQKEEGRQNRRVNSKSPVDAAEPRSVPAASIEAALVRVGRQRRQRGKQKHRRARAAPPSRSRRSRRRAPTASQRRAARRRRRRRRPNC